MSPNRLASAITRTRKVVGSPTFGLAGLGIIAVLGVINLYDSTKALTTGKQQAYWQKQLTCTGPDFRAPPPDPDSAPDEPRAIFRMTDRVVLAIPRHLVGGPWDENLPTTIAKCESIGDLPKIRHLYIQIDGKWSGAFDESELPKDNNGQTAYPDLVRLHILPAEIRPSSAVQKPVWNRAFLKSLAPGGMPLVPKENGILCGYGVLRSWCWVPFPGNDDLYAPMDIYGGGSPKLDLTNIQFENLPLRGLELTGKVMLRDVYHTYPDVLLTIQDRLDRWNIVRPDLVKDE